MDRILIFDFDGVLADTLDDMLRFAAQVCSELGHPCQPTAAHLEALDTMSFDEFGRQLGVPEPKIKAFTRLNLEKFATRTRPPRMFHGMDKVLAELSKSGRIGILTGNTASVVWEFLEHHQLSQHVAYVIDGKAPGSRSGKIRRIAGQIGRPGCPIYMIGDAVSDIVAAREAQAKSVAVTWGHQSSEKLMGASPDYLVHSPEELLQVVGVSR